MKRYYLGIDGGGTKTSYAVIDDDKNILYRSVGGPSSIDTLPLESVKKTILEETSKIPYKVSFVYAGIGGIVSQDGIDKVNNILKDIKCLENKDNVDSGNDVNNALFGALDGKDGIILISGTGSVAFGKHNNKYHRTGGYSYKEGDAGSAYDLGFKALQHLARVLDKREKNSQFAEKLKETINCYDYQSLANFFNEANRTQIASLAKIVTQFENDKYAKKIIINSANEAANLVNTTYRVLRFNTKTPLSIIGSLGNAKTLYRDILLSKLNKNIEVIDAIYNPTIGACLKSKSLYK